MSLEANKIAAAVLVAGMLTLSVGLAANMIYGSKEGHEGTPEATAEGAAPPVAPKAIAAPVSGLLASADVAKGAEVAKKCLTCHTFDAGAAAKVGPNLNGIIGAKHAHMAGFAYSDAMKGLSGDTWTYEALNTFLSNPKTAIKGTKMTFAGLPKVEDRANLIAWLRTQAPSEAPLPTAEEIKAAEDASAAAPAQEAAPAETVPAAEVTAPAEESSVPLIAASDPAVGEKTAAKCKACHTFDKGGPARVGPNLWGVVGGPTAHAEGFSYSNAIKGLGGNWGYAELDKFLMSPRDFAKGTKMTFAGLKKVEERAALIRWLRDQGDQPIPLP